MYMYSSNRLNRLKVVIKNNDYHVKQIGNIILRKVEEEHVFLKNIAYISKYNLS